MPRAIDLMKRREGEILEALKVLRRNSQGFSDPPLLLVGGYALRAFVPISRYTRDCDFVLPKRNGWHLDRIPQLLPAQFQVETLRKQGHYGYLRCLRAIREPDNTTIKIGLDFMEGAVVGRTERDRVRIDGTVVERSQGREVPIAGEELQCRVPSYRDYFLLKVVSSRPSDVRDIASLIREHGAPEGLNVRAGELLPNPEILEGNVRAIVKEVERDQFLDSWRGAFATSSFSEEDKAQVLEALNGLA